MTWWVADGLDERLHGRYRCDPAEFVTVLAGGSDGLHYGLWYDDPTELPGLIAHNYARDSAETWTNHTVTLLDELRLRIDRVRRDCGNDGEEALRLRPLGHLLDWFADADREALQQDGLPKAAATRQYSAISLFPLLPADSGDPRLAQSDQRITGYTSRTPEADEWIAQAHRELAAGLPAYALAVGAELHWLDHEQYRTQSRDLLVGAYRALGRHAFADLIDVHTTHRDLLSVNVLTPAP